MATASKNNILLESGTNELEILEFKVGGRNFGINVSKVLEILKATPVMPMPNADKYIHGVFKQRDSIMTLIDLPNYLNLGESDNPVRDIYIITNFYNATFAFHVHSVEVIHRVSWNMIEKPDSSVYGGEDGLATGIARVDDRLVTIIDFEKIISDISPMVSIKMRDVEKFENRKRCDSPIMIVEDSTLLEKLLLEALGRSGYTNLATHNDGQAAWEKLLEFKSMGGCITDWVKLIITDVEMPQMDGHRLIKLIREDPVLKHLPVIVFSSMISSEMRIKGEKLGASAQISKPQIGELVGIVDEFVLT